MVSFTILAICVVFAFAQLCSDGGVMYVGPYSGIPDPGSCVSSSGVAVSIKFDVCYKSTFSCNMPCDTSCCTSDFDSCMECTGCNAFYDSSFKVVNGSTYLYFDGNDTTCSTTAGVGDEFSCIYDVVHICQGNVEVDFTHADYLSRICTNEVMTTSSSSGTSLSSSSLSASTSSTTSEPISSGTNSNHDISGATQIHWILW